jgi:hypothetical protein
MHKKTATSKQISDATAPVHDRLARTQHAVASCRNTCRLGTVEEVKGVAKVHSKVVAFFGRANQKAHSLISTKHLQPASAGHMQPAEYFDDGTGYWGDIDPPTCWWIETASVFLAALAPVFMFIPC